MTDPATLHKLVWDFRAEAKWFWPTPNPLDALRCAFAEAGKAMNAFLRSKRPGDARNSERGSTVEEALADCAIMLLTALGPEWNEKTDWIGDLPRRDYVLGDVVDTVSQALRYRNDYLVLDALFTIRCSGLDLAAMIPQRLARIRARNLPSMRHDLLRIRMRKAAELASEMAVKTEEAEWLDAARVLHPVADLLDQDTSPLGYAETGLFWHQVEERLFSTNQDGGLCEEGESDV